MVIKQIEAFLTATFGLPIVADITQTKIENCVSYLIQSDIEVKNKIDCYQSLSLNITVYFRAINGYDSIGFLSHKIGKSKANHVNDHFYIANVSASESVEYESTTEIVISKDITIMMRANNDQVLERIKTIKMES